MIYLMNTGLKIVKLNLLNIISVIHYKSFKKREGEHIKNTECVNKLVAGRTKKEYNKEYKEQNIDKINERRTKICLCVCGKEYKAWSKSSHLKTIVHQNWLKENS